MNDIITVITKEVQDLWERSGIPAKDYRGCWDIVKQCIDKWTRAKKSEKESLKFQSDLNTLLDLRPVPYRTLSSLKVYLKKNDEINWKQDYDFFKGQLKHPQTGILSNRTDSILAQRKRVREESASKAAAFIKNNLGETSNSSIAINTPDKSMTYEMNVISNQLAHVQLSRKWSQLIMSISSQVRRVHQMFQVMSGNFHYEKGER